MKAFKIVSLCLPIMIFIGCIVYLPLNGEDENMEYNIPPIPNRFLTDLGQLVRIKILPIGPWDMVTNVTTFVPHGLGAYFFKILFVQAFVYNDAGTAIFPLARFGNAADPNLLNGGVGSFDAVNITLGRRTGGDFTTPFFQGAIANRGYITFIYFE